MWELILRSCLRRTRAPEVRPSSNSVIGVWNAESWSWQIIDPKLFPEGTCNACLEITLQGIISDSAGKYLSTVGRDQPTSCPMCKIIFGSIYNGDKTKTSDPVRLRVDVSKSEENKFLGRRIRDVGIMGPSESSDRKFTHKLGQFRIYAEPDSYASKFVGNRRPPLSNFSEITFQRISRWIKDCDETHSKCRSHASQFSESEMRYLPTRVVHVGSATQQPHIHISEKHQNDRYVALSHCWGRIPQVRTLESNIEQHKKEIIFERLSTTFKDALRMTRRLGMEYIWIDSLCIVQDNKDDWLRESEHMGSIYANAYITLAATSATDGSGGLNNVRPECNWIRFPCNGGDRTKGHMWCTDGSWTSMNNLDDAPLNSRGWVFQERELSRRIIHFASSQVYWECKQCLFAEECDNGSGFHDATLQPSLFWANVNAISNDGTILREYVDDVPEVLTPASQLDQFYIQWRNLLFYYHYKDFTKQSDRLVALLGIIRVVEKQTGLRCFDGHWEDNPRFFLRELMWFPLFQKTMSVLDDGTPCRLCSSWSWASLEGHVLHQNLSATTWTRHGLKDCDLRLEAIKEYVHIPWPSHPLRVSGMLRTVYRCKCRGNDYTYPPKDGRARALYKCECRTREYTEQSYQQGRTFLAKLEENGNACGWVCFDREDEEPEQFYLSPVYVATKSIACFALVERNITESSERWFERVGVANIEMVADDGKEEDYTSTYARVDLFESCERETYCIV